MVRRLTSVRETLRRVAGTIGTRIRRKPRVVEPPKVEPQKKVLMFGWELPPFNSGGLGVACYEMAQSVAKKNTAITFVLPRRQNVKASFMNIAFTDDHRLHSKGMNIKYKEVDVSLSPYLTAKKYNEERKKLSFWRLRKHGSDLMGEVFRYGDAARKIAKKEKFNIIHAHDWLAFPAGIEAKKASKKPLVAHVHSIEYDRCHEAGVDPAICAIEKEGLEKADKVIAISDYVKKRVVKYYGIDEKKIEIVHNGINLDKYSPKKYTLKSLKANGTKMVLFTGRITYQKGVDYLIAAAKKVVAKNDKVIFMVVGTGDMQNQIINQAAELGLSNKVFFPGFLRGADLEKIYKSADLYVMPSVSEPFGLVALEALANKVPVIVSNQSGVAEVVEHALKVDFWDVDELANKILAVINHSALQKTLSFNGHENVQRCTWDLAADKLINIYNGLSPA